MTDKFGQIYGGMLLKVYDPSAFQPITFPFEGEDVLRGNHVHEHESAEVWPFDYWQTSVNAETARSLVVERGVTIDAMMVGHNTERVLRDTMHRVLTVNQGVMQEDRENMLDTLGNLVLPQIQTSALIHLNIKSSQPKFVIFSRDIPLYIHVFVDDSCMIMMWSNESDLDKRVRDHYKTRFSVYRMKPVVNRVLVLHTYYLKKKFTHWKNTRARNHLLMLNVLEEMMMRRTKSDTEDQVSNSTG